MEWDSKKASYFACYNWTHREICSVKKGSHFNPVEEVNNNDTKKEHRCYCIISVVAFERVFTYLASLFCQNQTGKIQKQIQMQSN